MANMTGKDATGVTKYLKSTGVGTDLDPHVSEHLETNSADILTASEAIQAAVEGVLSVDDNGGSLTVDGTVAVSSLPALPAGTNNIGDVDVVSITLPTAIYNGQTSVTTAGTGVALASSQAILSGVTIKAKSTNTGFIYVGNSSVSSSNGFRLSAGDTIFVEVANLSTVYIDSSVSGEGVSYIAT